MIPAERRMIEKAAETAQLTGFLPLPRTEGGHPARMANERQVTALLRYLHLCGGTVYQEKLVFPGWVIRTAARRLLVHMTTLDGRNRLREGHAQIAITEFGLAFLKMRDCLRFGQESDQPLGLRDYDADFSAILLRGEAGFVAIPYTEQFE